MTFAPSGPSAGLGLLFITVALATPLQTAQTAKPAHNVIPLHHAAFGNVRPVLALRTPTSLSGSNVPDTERRFPFSGSSLPSLLWSVGALLLGSLGGYAYALQRRSKGDWVVASTVEEPQEAPPKGLPAATPAFNRMGREQEVDSQYRKLRLLIYASVALICSLLSIFYATQVLGEMVNGPVSTDTLTDFFVNVFAVIFVAALFRVDKVPEQKLLERTEEGGALATLRIRYAGERVMVGAFRSQEGRRASDRRVVILGCNALALQSHLQYLLPFGSDLSARGFLLVPVALPMTRAATIDHALAYRNFDRSLFQGSHIAVPNGGDWVSIFGAECDKALAAGVLPVETGFALVIERDGRVGRRIPGLPTVEELMALPEL